MANRKLKKILDEADRLESKIAEFQAQLQAVRATQRLEENEEIVKSIRSLALSDRELFALMSGLQDGSVTLLRQELSDGSKTSGTAKARQEEKEKMNETPQTVPEREAEYEKEDV